MLGKTGEEATTQKNVEKENGQFMEGSEKYENGKRNDEAAP